MYKSPIELLITDIQNQIVKQQDDEVYKAVVHYIPNIDKEELLRALKYDRRQYEKGYAYGKADAMAELVHCKDCTKVWCYLRQELGEDGFCSAGERRTDDC